MTDPNAVFLSYASQDADAARRICEALRATGIEVWFDQSELRGGDAWDQKIRQQIRDCALFIPIISSTTASRGEGYFRLEWGLADQRSQMMARNRAFLVPVCIDPIATSADVPESFTRVQWMRLPRGAAPPAFCERIAALLERRASSGTVPVARSAQRDVAEMSAGAMRIVAPRGVSRHRKAGASLALAVLPLVNESEKGEPTILLRWTLRRPDYDAFTVLGTQGNRPHLLVSVPEL